MFYDRNPESSARFPGFVWQAVTPFPGNPRGAPIFFCAFCPEGALFEPPPGPGPKAFPTYDEIAILYVGYTFREFPGRGKNR